jgi:TPR repeat protein
MRPGARDLRLLIMAVALAAGHALAGPLEDGVAAYRRQDYAKALSLFLELAKNGNATAQYNLGVMYSEGQGVPQDDQQALFWYRKPAEQGDADAQLSLGLMYAKGQGTPQDFEQAVVWYRKAAEQGNATAQFNLGLKYANGQGVPRDDQKAYFWWLLASASGDLDSISNRDMVEARLTPEQRAAAQAEARHWKPRRP